MVVSTSIIRTMNRCAAAMPMRMTLKTTGNDTSYNNNNNNNTTTTTITTTTTTTTTINVAWWLSG